VFRLRHVVSGLLCACLIGCGGAPKELTTPTKVVTWPAMAELKSPEVGMGVFRSIQMGDTATLQATLNDNKIEEAVKKFEQEPIPKQFASKAREDLKAEVVKDYKALISGGKSGASFDDLKKTATSIQQNLEKLADPKLK
jgi:hypothetical protein